MNKLHYFLIFLLLFGLLPSLSGQNSKENVANIEFTFDAKDKLDCDEMNDHQKSKFCTTINAKGATEITTSVIDVPFETPKKLFAFSVNTKLFTSHSHDVHIDYKVLNKTDGWSDWLPLGEDTHDYDEEVYSSNLAFIRPDDTRVKFKITGVKMAENKFNIFFINLPESKSEDILMESDDEKNASCPKPNVLSRLSYLSAQNEANHGTPSYTNVTHTVVHHANWSTSTANPAWSDVAYAVWYLHRINKGWSDIAYNYLIDPNGVIYEGRAGGDNVKGVALCNNHDNLMAVCMLGAFHNTNQYLTFNARNSLVDILAWKMAKENIDPLGNSFLPNYGNKPHLMGHRDGCSTACPGDNIYNVLGNIKTVLNNEINACGNSCTDSKEPNNTASQAYYLGAPTTSTVTNLCLAGNDYDYFKVSANGQNYYIKVRLYSPSSTQGKFILRYVKSGNTLTIETQSFSGSNIDTYLHLYSSNGTTQLASNDDSGAGLFSKITYTIPSSGGGCSTPSYAYTTNVTPYSCYMYWSAVSAASYYSLWYWNGSSAVNFSTTGATGLNLTGLSPGSIYWLGVKAQCSGTSSNIRWTYVTAPSYLALGSNGQDNNQINTRGEEGVKVKIPEGAATSEEMNVRVYPNPFRDKSTIEFTLLEDSQVTAFITDITGKKIAILADNESQTVGTHQLIFEGNGLSAGTYYCTIIAGEYKSVQKIVLTK